MGDTGGNGNGDSRFYRQATFLSLVAIVIFAVFYSVDFMVEGRGDKIWVVLSGCAACGFVIVLFRRAKGFLNPAFSVPFMIYLLYLAGAVISGRFTGYFSVFFCICGLAAMYFNPGKFLRFIFLSNGISLFLILGRVPMTRSGGYTFTELLVNWTFMVIGSVFMYLVIQFVSTKIHSSAQAEDSFTTMLNSTPDYIVLVDELNYVTHISKPLAEFAHIEDPEMAIGRPLLDLFRDMDIKLKAAEIVDSGGFYEGTWELHLGGETRYFRIISNRLLGSTPGLFINLSDISPVMKARIEAEEAARAKSAFLANTSHEIRTPMNAILGMVELILRKDISPDVYEDARSIRQAGKNLLSIINDILDFSKIESGKLDIIPVEYRLDSLLNDVISIIRMRLAEKQLCFISRIDGSLPSVLIGDEVRVRQVLLNLLGNAVKYTKEGDICLGIHAEAGAGPATAGANPGGDRVNLVFEVSDSGVGIKPEDMKRLFGEFVQFDTRKNRGVEGTGLGLAISRNLCQLMGGDIGAESEYGRGSTFRAVIPQGVKDPAPFARVEGESAGKILIYEKRRKQAEALAYTMEHLGLPCLVASGGEEFAEMLRREQPRYALIGSSLFGAASPLLQAVPDVQPVFISDYGESAPLPEVWTLPAPVQPAAIVRLLSGQEEGPSLIGGDSPQTKFTAPGARLLVVDDIATNLKVAEGLLAPYLASVETCLSGEEAIGLIKRRDYDIVFMDHMMPEMDGVEATTLIRAWEKEQASSTAESPRPLPIIALTANAVSGMKEMFLSQGFSDFLAKPIEVSRLDEIMGRWVPQEKRKKPEPGKRGEVSPPGSSPRSGLPPPPSAGDTPATPPVIPGVDTAHGITMTGGTLAGYKQVLSLFRKDAEDRLGLLRKIPEAAGLPAFTTQVHALKSASGTLGAAEISAGAARLEAAGKAGDLDVIREELPGFAAALAELTENIRAALNVSGEQAAAPEGGAAAHTPLFRELAEALESQKAEAIDRVLEELESKITDQKTREILDAISDDVLMTEFDKALETVRSLLEKDNNYP